MKSTGNDRGRSGNSRGRPGSQPQVATNSEYSGIFTESSFISEEISTADREEVDLKRLAESFLPKLTRPARSIKNMYRKQQKQQGNHKAMAHPIEAWPEHTLPAAVTDKVKAYKSAPIATEVTERKKSIILLDPATAQTESNNTNNNIIGSNNASGSANNTATGLRAAPIPGPLKSMNRKLRKQQADSRTDENVIKLQLLKDANAMVNQMPLRYLYSKPELRQYAHERVMRPIIQLAKKTLRERVAFAFAVWKVPREMKMNEKQIGFMVIAKRLIKLYEHALSKKFRIWAFNCSSRFIVERCKHLTYFVVQIQQWYRHMSIVKKEPWRMLERAVEICLHRRRAIKHMMQIEAAKRQALIKVRRGVLARRRMYFAVRAIQRNYRWVLLCRKTRWRLTRIQAVRKLQTWRRMLLCRDETDWALIHLILRCGGYSKVHKKVPHKLLRQWPLLKAVDKTISMLQKAWFISKGNYALFLKFQARKAFLAHQKLLNDMANVIQSNARARLWVKLLTAAFQHNRARRIQRGFRSYQYRKWLWLAVNRGRRRRVRHIQRAYRKHRWLKFLHDRFKLRRYIIVFTRAKNQLAAVYIQRSYRAYKIRERIRKEELKKFYAQQRARAGLVIAIISKIQRNWRQMKNPRMFSRHVYLLMRRLYLEKRRKFNQKARAIQQLARTYLAKKAAKLLAKQTKGQRVIAYFAKAYLLKLALFDRVQATRERRIRAANFIKWRLRGLLWMRFINVRFAIQRARLDLEQLRHWSANFIQRNMHRKFTEYHIAVRVAGR